MDRKESCKLCLQFGSLTIALTSGTYLLYVVQDGDAVLGPAHGHVSHGLHHVSSGVVLQDPVKHVLVLINPTCFDGPSESYISKIS